jgi:spermidine/putrescine transport system permease protein
VAVEAQEVARPVAPRLGRRARPGLTTAGLLAPPILWLCVFFLVPVALIFLYSVNVFSLYPGGQYFTLDAWRNFIEGSISFDPFWTSLRSSLGLVLLAALLAFPIAYIVITRDTAWKYVLVAAGVALVLAPFLFSYDASIFLGLFWKSIRMSLIVSVIAVLAAYPIAYYLALVATKRKYVLLLLILAPFLVSYFLRLLAWKVILGDQGMINSFLVWTGLRAEDDPVAWLLYSQFAVVLTLIYVYVPFVALPIFVALESLDRRLLEAAADLGASRWQAFWRVTFPLSVPGVIAAFIFVFIPTIGEYFTPLLVGGVNGTMFGNAIADQFGQSLNWLNGSVLSFFLLTVVGVLMALFARFLTVRRLATG